MTFYIKLYYNIIYHSRRDYYRMFRAGTARFVYAPRMTDVITLAHFLLM